MAKNRKPLCRFCGIAVVVLLLALVAVLYKFIVVGQTVRVAEDPRRAIVLDPPERALVLTEMRGFLTAVQQITDAAVRNDAKAIAAAAKPMGMAAAGGVPPTLAGKLPLEFKQLGFSVHQDFDRIVLDAEAMGDTRHSLTQLGEILGKCVACHAMFQITAPAVH